MAAELAASLASTARLEEARREAADARQQAEAARARAMELDANWASSKLVRLGVASPGGAVLAARGCLSLPQHPWAA